MNSNVESNYSNDVILVGYLRNHHPIYLGLIKFLLSFYKSISFLTTSGVYTQLKNDIDLERVNVHIDDRKINKLLLNNRNLMKKFKVLIVDEYFGGFIKTFNIRFKNQLKIGIIHNVNKWFLVRKSLYFYIDLIFKTRYFAQFDSYIVMSPIVKKYLQAFTENKKVFFFPVEENNETTLFSHKIAKEMTNKILKIVIPGMITEKRREYINFLMMLKKYYSEHPNSIIRINLLGSINVKENLKEREIILKLINEINEGDQNRIIYGDSFIPKDEFSRAIESADLILSNTKVFNLLEDRAEIYGITKITGISYTLYFYEKPAIVPNYQNILSGFDSQMIKYKNFSDLYSKFEMLEKGEISLKSLKMNAQHNRKQFNLLINDEKKELEKFIKETN